MYRNKYAKWAWLDPNQWECLICEKTYRYNSLGELDDHWRDNHITPFEMIEELRRAGIETDITTYSDRYSDVSEPYVIIMRSNVAAKSINVSDPEAMIRRIYNKWRTRKEA